LISLLPSDRRQYMLDPSPHLDDPLMAPMLTFGQLARGVTPSLNLRSISTSFSVPIPALRPDRHGQLKRPYWCWFAQARLRNADRNELVRYRFRICGPACNAYSHSPRCSQSNFCHDLLSKRCTYVFACVLRATSPQA
jgi:hypothetical protein